MSKLLYHRPAEAVALSPFDVAVMEVARDGPLRIASPYISVTYLARALSLCEDWRLISDVREWLTALPPFARPRTWQFIREHVDRIHHYEDLHAKVVIGRRTAMFGSANLTRRGILARAELGMHLDDAAQVAELSRWFDELWAETSPVAIDEANAFIQWLDTHAAQPSTRRADFVFSSRGRRIRASLVSLDGPRVSLKEIGRLELAVVAQELVNAEQSNATSLDEAFERSLDSLAATGTFGLREAAAAVRQRVPSVVLRDVYAILLRHCANHPRTVFTEGTINRLILENGQFEQSSKPRLGPALERFDRFLALLVDELDFAEPRHLPTEQDLDVRTGFAGNDQMHLTSGLLESGVLEMSDSPGELPRYRLQRDFEWRGRFANFSTAHAKWRSKQLTTPVVAPTPRIEESEEDVYALAATSDTHTVIERTRAVVQRRGAIDSWMAGLVRLMANGERFEGPSADAVIELTATSLGVDVGLAHAVMTSFPDDERVFALTQRANDHVWTLDINPGLTWKSLQRYPQTRTACEVLLRQWLRASEESALLCLVTAARHRSIGRIRILAPELGAQA